MQAKEKERTAKESFLESCINVIMVQETVRRYCLEYNRQLQQIDSRSKEKKRIDFRLENINFVIFFVFVCLKFKNDDLDDGVLSLSTVPVQGTLVKGRYIKGRYI